MREFLFQYHGVSPTTWVYLSSLLMISMFFKFSRFWSLRNLDLLMLIGLAPGLLFVHFGWYMQRENAQPIEVAGSPNADAKKDPIEDGGAMEAATNENGAVNGSQENVNQEEVPPTLSNGQRTERIGYLWLFAGSGMWLIRMLLDPMMVRRPLLMPNLSVGGLAFMGVALFIFLMANVVATSKDDGPANPQRVERMENQLIFESDRGPGHAVLNTLPTGGRKIVAVSAHFAVVLGIILIGYRHFDNITNGIGVATLYLMVPYTSQLTGRVEHVLPAAFLIWAVFYYRRPAVAGLLIGASSGCVYFPLFLIPLWFSFYWQKGWLRFLMGLGASLTVMAVGLVLVPQSSGFVADVQRMFGLFKPAMEGLEGMWNTNIGGWDPRFRLPVLAMFVVLSFSLALWPTPKNLGTLLSCSTAVMIACQFWHGYGGGLFMAWYLPLLLLTIFRPNLEDRGARLVISRFWFKSSRKLAST